MCVFPKVLDVSQFLEIRNYRPLYTYVVLIFQNVSELQVCMYGHTYSKSMDQPGKVANPACGKLNRENVFFLRPRSRLRIWSRETGSAVPSRVSLVISILRLNLVTSYGLDFSRSGGVQVVACDHAPDVSYSIFFK